MEHCMALVILVINGRTYLSIFLLLSDYIVTIYSSIHRPTFSSILLSIIHWPQQLPYMYTGPYFYSPLKKIKRVTIYSSIFFISLSSSYMLSFLSLTNLLICPLACPYSYWPQNNSASLLFIYPFFRTSTSIINHH